MNYFWWSALSSRWALTRVSFLLIGFSSRLLHLVPTAVAVSFKKRTETYPEGIDWHVEAGDWNLTRLRSTWKLCFPLPKEYLIPMFPRARASVLNSKPVCKKKEDSYLKSTFRVIFQILHFSFQILCPGNNDVDCCKSQLATQLFCQFICKRILRNLIQHSDFFFKSICWWWEDKRSNFTMSCVSWNREMCGEVCTVSNLSQLNFVFRGWFNSLQNLLRTEYNTNKVRN